MTTLPPFSGDDPTCPKCSHVGALTRYRPAQSLIVGPGDLDRVSDTEHLERECRRCDYRWPEAIAEPLADRERELLERQHREERLRERVEHALRVYAVHRSRHPDPLPDCIACRIGSALAPEEENP